MVRGCQRADSGDQEVCSTGSQGGGHRQKGLIRNQLGFPHFSAVQSRSILMDQEKLKSLGSGPPWGLLLPSVPLLVLCPHCCLVTMLTADILDCAQV